MPEDTKPMIDPITGGERMKVRYPDGRSADMLISEFERIGRAHGITDDQGNEAPEPPKPEEKPAE